MDVAVLLLFRLYAKMWICSSWAHGTGRLALLFTGVQELHATVYAQCLLLYVGFLFSRDLVISAVRPQTGALSCVQVQVLEDLPTDLAMEVLRRAPGSLASKLQQLPPALRSLAALASCLGLPAACMLPSARVGTPPDQPKLPEMCLCVDTSREPSPEVAAAAGGPCGASCGGGACMAAPAHSKIWVHNDSIAQHDSSLFSLQQRPGMVACRLLARAGSLEGMTIVLPATGCLVLGPGTVDLQGVTFKGAPVAFWPLQG